MHIHIQCLTLNTLGYNLYSPNAGLFSCHTYTIYWIWPFSCHTYTIYWIWPFFMPHVYNILNLVFFHATRIQHIEFGLFSCNTYTLYWIWPFSCHTYTIYWIWYCFMPDVYTILNLGFFHATHIPYIEYGYLWN